MPAKLAGYLTEATMYVGVGRRKTGRDASLEAKAGEGPVRESRSPGSRSLIPDRWKLSSEVVDVN
jgi:hypothetical protein